MIQTKEDSKYYLEEDRKAYHKEKLTGLKAYIRDIVFHDYNYEYIKNLRKWEYQLNSGGGDFNIFMLGGAREYNPNVALICNRI